MHDGICRKCGAPAERPYCDRCTAEITDHDLARALTINAALQTSDSTEGAARGLVALVRALEHWTDDEGVLGAKRADYHAMLARARQLTDCERHGANCLVAPVLLVLSQLPSPVDPAADPQTARELVRAVWSVLRAVFPGGDNPWRGAVLSVLFAHGATECEPGEEERARESVMARVPEVRRWLETDHRGEPEPARPNAPGGDA